MAKSKAIRTLEEIAGPLTFGRLLWAIRTGEEMTLAAFAEPLGVTRQRLNDIEKGRETVSPERAAKWAETLGYSPAQFVRLALQAQLDGAGLGDLHVEVTDDRPRHIDTYPEELARNPPPKGLRKAERDLAAIKPKAKARKVG